MAADIELIEALLDEYKDAPPGSQLNRPWVVELEIEVRALIAEVEELRRRDPKLMGDEP